MTRIERIAEKIKFWLYPYWSVICDVFAWTLAGFVRITMDAMEQAFAPQLRPIIDKALKSGKVPPELEGILGEIKEPKSFTAAFFGQAAASGATGGVISSTLGPFLLLLQYEMQRMANQARWDPATAAAILFRAAGIARALGISEDQVRSLLESDVRDQGWTMERFRAFIDAASTRLQEMDLITLRRRGLITQEDFLARMYELGYTKDRAEDLYTSKLFYPSPGDLINWQAKEVFEPDMIARYGLDAEVENVEREAFYKAGMTDEQIVNYWRAHWVHPSWTQVQEMLHRGEMTEDMVWEWFRVVEIPPFWRQKMINVSYSPLTRVDVRRMHKVGTVSDADLVRAYQDVGFSPANAKRMADFTIAYNAADTKELTRSQIEALYKKQTLTRVEAEDRLRDLGYGQYEIDLMLDAANVGTLERVRDLTVTNLRDLYVLGVKTKAETTNELSRLGYKQIDIEALYALWEFEKPASTRQPSRTDLDQFLENAVIDFYAWVAEYRGLGYPDKYIEWYFNNLVAKGKVE